MKIFVVLSAPYQSTECKDIEMITSNEQRADNYANEMDECCTAGRSYWVEVWEVEDKGC